ncbi:protein DA1 [Amycolatopsis sp. cmx-4-61]|uniref:protein DA1 n=1 Tax=Amycolatopsis sp. cmx-4-61 TaxID=2790937 RepID=UPI00397E7662
MVVNGMAALALRGDLSCATHHQSVFCAFCERRERVSPATWRDLGGGLLRCGLCARDAIDFPHQAGSVLVRVRESLSRRGLVLREPAKVRLVPLSELLEMGGERGHTMGATTLRYPRDGPGRVTGVRLAAGLPLEVFYRVAAHEFGHAWIAQRRRSPLRPEVAEGLSEALAYGVLRDLESSFAESIRERMKLNPDPLYGEGFRTVRTHILRFGLTAVLETLVRDGELPGSSLA